MATTAFPVNPTLTAIAIGYKNRDVDLIADQAMPRITKVGKKFSYTTYPAAEAYTVPDTRVGPKSRPNTVSFSGTIVNAECKDYGLDDYLANDEIKAWEDAPKAAGAVGPLEKSVSMLTGLVMLDREQRVAGQVFNTANHTNNTTLAGTSQWSDYANSDPIKEILTKLDVPLMRPNTLVLGEATWTVLRMHPKVAQAVYKSAQGAGVVTRQMLADLLEVKQILVGAGWVNTAKRGQTASISRVWGKHCAALFVSPDQADADQPTWGWTAQWGDKFAGEKPVEEMGLRGATLVRSGESVVEVVSAPDVSYYWQNAVA